MSLHTLALALENAPAPVEWFTHDADDRYPGQFTSHCATVEAHGQRYHVRITPGDASTFSAPGYYADIRPDTHVGWSAEHTSLTTLKALVLQMIADDHGF